MQSADGNSTGAGREGRQAGQQASARSVSTTTPDKQCTLGAHCISVWSCAYMLQDAKATCNSSQGQLMLSWHDRGRGAGAAVHVHGKLKQGQAALSPTTSAGPPAASGISSVCAGPPGRYTNARGHTYTIKQQGMQQQGRACCAVYTCCNTADSAPAHQGHHPVHGPANKTDKPRPALL